MVDYGQGFHLGPQERLGAFAVLVSALGSLIAVPAVAGEVVTREGSLGSRFYLVAGGAPCRCMAWRSGSSNRARRRDRPRAPRRCRRNGRARGPTPAPDRPAPAHASDRTLPRVPRPAQTI